MDYQILSNVFTRGEIGQILHYAAASLHHDDDGGHGSEGGHLETIKPNCLPIVAAKISERFGPDNTLHNFWAVDPWMKLYRLTPESAAVPPHMDKDFRAPKRLTAEWSVLVYLSDDYEGGETVFDTTWAIPHPVAGDVLLFPHSQLHEGRKVTKGEKIVLKTDLLFSR
jgi:hypothetical protein